MPIDFNSIPGIRDKRIGLPRPDWVEVRDWLATFTDQPEQNEAWNLFAEKWLAALIEALPDGYRVHESDGFYLLSQVDEASSGRMLRWCESSQRKIDEFLPEIVFEEQGWKMIVLALSGRELYCNYVADFYPEMGEFGMSGGMCMADLGHIVLCVIPNADLERTIAHELVHGALAPLPLPLWLNEGVTQVLEDMIVDVSSFQMNSFIKNEHRAFWNEKTIDEFWAGDSFYRPDDGQHLSYSLAQVLVLNIISGYGKKLNRFLIEAQKSDAGNAAAGAVFDVSLGERVAQFLGPGNWQPSGNYETMDAETEIGSDSSATSDT